MAHVTYEYEEVEDAPKRLRAHCTPAVDAPFEWIDNQMDEVLA
jgi:hypothetical protein